MAHDEPPHQDLHCLQIQLFSSLIVKELTYFFQLEGTKTLVLSDSVPGGISYSYTMVYLPVGGDNPRALASGLSLTGRQTKSFSEWIISQTGRLTIDYFQYRQANRGIAILYHPHQCKPCSV